jgi:hypothetical protein
MSMWEWFKRWWGRGGRIEAKLDRVLEQGMIIMSKTDDLKSAISDINDATNAVAARIDALSAKTVGEPITQEEIDALKAASARLKALAADPTDPVPVVPDPAAPAA